MRSVYEVLCFHVQLLLFLHVMTIFDHLKAAVGFGSDCRNSLFLSSRRKELDLYFCLLH